MVEAIVVVEDAALTFVGTNLLKQNLGMRSIMHVHLTSSFLLQVNEAFTSPHVLCRQGKWIFSVCFFSNCDVGFGLVHKHVRCESHFGKPLLSSTRWLVEVHRHG